MEPEVISRKEVPSVRKERRGNLRGPWQYECMPIAELAPRFEADRKTLWGCLRMALAARHPLPGSLIHHSDRGVQHACGDYSALLATHGIQPSMSRIGSRTTTPRPRAP